MGNTPPKCGPPAYGYNNFLRKFIMKNREVSVAEAIQLAATEWNSMSTCERNKFSTKLITAKPKKKLNCKPQKGQLKRAKKTAQACLKKNLAKKLPKGKSGKVKKPTSHAFRYKSKCKSVRR